MAVSIMIFALLTMCYIIRHFAFLSGSRGLIKGSIIYILLSMTSAMRQWYLKYCYAKFIILQSGPPLQPLARSVASWIRRGRMEYDKRETESWIKIKTYIIIAYSVMICDIICCAQFILKHDLIYLEFLSLK